MNCSMGGRAWQPQPMVLKQLALRQQRLAVSRGMFLPTLIHMNQSC